jgi:hypothetical protein
MRRGFITSTAFCFLASCSNSGVKAKDGKDDAYALLRETCLNAINQYRAGKGAPPLTQWEESESCVDSEASTDFETQKAHGSYGKCQEHAQNACPNWEVSEASLTKCLASMYAEGPGGGHYDNMMNTGYTSVACGFYSSTKTAGWMIQNFR